PIPDAKEVNAFERILTRLRKATGTDFSSYKKPTLMRRVRRRMALWKIERLGEYASWLEHHPGELETLHHDFLINVTTFFRDPETFTVLANDVIPRILDERRPDAPVRDVCVFAPHNVIRDPPFSRLDLVSCRNVLIYLEASEQKRVLSSLHYALMPSGFLLLGSSETVGVSSLFDVLDKSHRVYTKRILAAALPEHFIDAAGLAAGHARPGGGPRDGVQRQADRIMLNRYGPPGVLVDDKLDILQFRGDTATYLEHLTGESSLNLLRMLRKGPLAEVREALHEARTQDRPARREASIARGGK